MHVKNSKTAQDARRKLKTICFKISLANRMQMHEKLLTRRLKDNNDARWYVHELARMRTQLRAVEFVIKDKLYNLALLRNSLPRLGNLTISLEAQIDFRFIEHLHARIKKEETRQKVADDIDAKANTVQPCSSKRRFHEKPKKTPTSLSCKKKGHKTS